MNKKVCSKYQWTEIAQNAILFTTSAEKAPRTIALTLGIPLQRQASLNAIIEKQASLAAGGWQ